MSSVHLANRANWQKLSTDKAHSAEHVFNAVIGSYIEHHHPNWELIVKPKDLKGIYGTRTAKNGKQSPHGIEPEFCIRNHENGKGIYGEIKNQGENGNAHERACKYWMPGLVDSIREIAKQDRNVYPVWIIFNGLITHDPNRCQEILHWFKGFERNVLLWKDFRQTDVLKNHFKKRIVPLLV